MEVYIRDHIRLVQLLQIEAHKFVELPFRIRSGRETYPESISDLRYERDKLFEDLYCISITAGVQAIDVEVAFPG